MTAIGGRPKPELCFLPGRLSMNYICKMLIRIVEGSSGFERMRWTQVNVCVFGSFIFPNWQSFVWNYFRMRT